MKPFTTLHGIAATLPLANVDTDKILPGRYLTTVTREGLGDVLFDSLRREPGGALRPEFILNTPPYDKANILVALENFGCGSSREHAPWALLDFGIRCIIAPSFADIFAINCSKNGILALRQPRDAVDRLIEVAAAPATARFTVDLSQQRLVTEDAVYSFDIDSAAKRRLLDGVDEISSNLGHLDKIAKFETTRAAECHRFPAIPTNVAGPASAPAKASHP